MTRLKVGPRCGPKPKLVTLCDSAVVADDPGPEVATALLLFIAARNGRTLAAAMAKYTNRSRAAGHGRAGSGQRLGPALEALAYVPRACPDRRRRIPASAGIFTCKAQGRAVDETYGQEPNEFVGPKIHRALRKKIRRAT